MARLVAAIFIPVIVLAAVICPGALAQPRDSVTVGLPSEPDSIIPNFSRLAVAGQVSGILFVGLVGLNSEWHAHPQMAREVPTLENGLWRLLPSNEAEVTFRLRAGSKWHDGAPVAAGDFVFAWEVAREPRSGAVAPDPAIASVTAPDPSTVVVRWKERRVGANTGYVPLPRHMLEASFRENPAGIRAGPFASRPVGNGPYRFVEWTRGQSIRLQGVEDYLGGRPAISAITFRFATPPGAGREELHVDFTGAGAGPQHEPVIVMGLVFEHIALNLDNPWLRDRRVRQALLHAIDRETIRREAGWVAAEVAHSWLPPWHAAFNSGVRQYAADADAARRLLAEAGWSAGPDGILRNAAGERMEMVLMTTPGQALRERTQDLLIARWRAVGISVRKNNPPDFFNLLGQRRFPHLAMFAWVLSVNTTGLVQWHSSQVPGDANRFQGSNYYGWRNPDNDRVLDQASQELSDAQRLGLMQRQQEIWAEELPAVPLWFRNEVAYVHRNLQGVRPTGIPGGWTWNVHEWAWRP